MSRAATAMAVALILAGCASRPDVVTLREAGGLVVLARRAAALPKRPDAPNAEYAHVKEAAQ